MGIKLGRNEPCFCGRGKKYKKCCILQEATDTRKEVADFQWRKLRKLEGIIFDKHLTIKKTILLRPLLLLC